MVTSQWLATKPEVYSIFPPECALMLFLTRSQTLLAWHLELQLDHRFLIRVSLSEVLETEHCFIVAAHIVGTMNHLT